MAVLNWQSRNDVPFPSIRMPTVADVAAAQQTSPLGKGFESLGKAAEEYSKLRSNADVGAVLERAMALNDAKAVQDALASGSLTQGLAKTNDPEVYKSLNTLLSNMTTREGQQQEQSIRGYAQDRLVKTDTAMDSAPAQALLQAVGKGSMGGVTDALGLWSQDTGSGAPHEAFAKLMTTFGDPAHKTGTLYNQQQNTAIAGMNARTNRENSIRANTAAQRQAIEAAETRAFDTLASMAMGMSPQDRGLFLADMDAKDPLAARRVAMSIKKLSDGSAAGLQGSFMDALTGGLPVLPSGSTVGANTSGKADPATTAAASAPLIPASALSENLLRNSKSNNTASPILNELNIATNAANVISQNPPIKNFLEGSKIPEGSSFRAYLPVINKSLGVTLSPEEETVLQNRFERMKETAEGKMSNEDLINTLISSTQVAVTQPWTKDVADFFRKVDATIVAPVIGRDVEYPTRIINDSKYIDELTSTLFGDRALQQKEYNARKETLSEADKVRTAYIDAVDKVEKVNALIKRYGNDTPPALTSQRDAAVKNLIKLSQDVQKTTKNIDSRFGSKKGN